MEQELTSYYVQKQNKSCRR